MYTLYEQWGYIGDIVDETFTIADRNSLAHDEQEAWKAVIEDET